MNQSWHHHHHPNHLDDLTSSTPRRRSSVSSRPYHQETITTNELPDDTCRSSSARVLGINRINPSNHLDDSSNSTPLYSNLFVNPITTTTTTTYSTKPLNSQFKSKQQQNPSILDSIPITTSSPVVATVALAATPIPTTPVVQPLTTTTTTSSTTRLTSTTCLTTTTTTLTTHHYNGHHNHHDMLVQASPQPGTTNFAIQDVSFSASAATQPVISIPVRNRSSGQYYPAVSSSSSSLHLKPAYSPSSVTSIKIEKQQQDEASSSSSAAGCAGGGGGSTMMNDTRLLIPVINVSSSKSSNPVPTAATTGSSIIDESRMLLKEYEQLRNDSVSEIQRAHDSLNAR